MAKNVKYGAYVLVSKKDRTVEYEITFMLPPEAEHTDAVFAAATLRASKRWKSFDVVETWRY